MSVHDATEVFGTPFHLIVEDRPKDPYLEAELAILRRILLEMAEGERFVCLPVDEAFLAADVEINIPAWMERNKIAIEQAAKQRLLNAPPDPR